MAIIKNPTDLNDPVNYVATIAFFCCITCVILMLRFKFKARLNISSPNLNHAEVPTVSITGGYRPQREEYFGISSNPDPRVKITPAMVKLSMYNNNEPPMRPAKSTNDLKRTDIMPVTSSKSTPDISHDPRGSSNNNVQLRSPEKTPKELKKEEKEKKKLEKKLMAEKKAKRKAAQDRAKIEAKKAQDRAKIEAKKAQDRAKIEAKKAQDNVKIEAKKSQDQAKIDAKNAKQQPKENKQTAPIASSSAGVPMPRAQTGPPGLASAPNRKEVVSTISIQSDINRNSGPPPYSELPIGEKNESDNSGNTSFSKPIDSSSSWDMISQHRQQINRPIANIASTSRKQVVMDLQYKRNNNSDPDNSEA